MRKRKRAEEEIEASNIRKLCGEIIQTVLSEMMTTNAVFAFKGIDEKAKKKILEAVSLFM
jgi:hypothetical protein